MGFSFNSFNNERLFTFDTTPITGKYVKLKELYEKYGADKVYQIKALFINTKSDINEEEPVAALEDTYVNLPVHQLRDVKKMRGDKIAVSAINRGYCGFTIRVYEKEVGKSIKTCYAAQWCDVDPEDFVDDPSDLE